MPLSLLESSTQSRLRSTQILTSLPQLISELVQNSLDADAKHIDIGIDAHCATPDHGEAWDFWVRDDGVGISRDGLKSLSEQGRYSTSKAYDSHSLDSITTFGFRGEALASAADLCCLEISSRTQRDKETWSLILKGGNQLFLGPAIRWRRNTPGTVVSVRDAFYNLPIRRSSHPSHAKTVELIRKELETFALVFPSVTFSLEKNSQHIEGSAGRTRLITISPSPSTLATFRQIYGRALAEHVEEISESSGKIHLEGFLSLEGAFSKAYQFIYVNRRLIYSNDLHRIIDAKFASSVFAKHAYDDSGKFRSPNPHIRRSPRKNEKKPVYVLHLTAPPHSVDNLFEPNKSVIQFENWERISTLLSDVVQAFLVKHEFITGQTEAIAEESQRPDSPSPLKRRKLTSSTPSKTRSRPLPNHQDVAEPESIVANPTLVPDSEVDVPLKWWDPCSGKMYLVNRRTGNSKEQTGHDGESTEKGVANEGRRNLKRSVTEPGDSHDMPEWMRDTLMEWENPVYKGPDEAEIKSLTLATTNLSFTSSTHAPTFLQPSISHFFSNTDSRGPARKSIRRRFDKNALRTARVIEQVDGKFIACIFGDVSDEDKNGGQEDEMDLVGRGDHGAGTLVLIDQHAADERIRVERFMRELCVAFLKRSGRNGVDPDTDIGSRMQEINPPKGILLTRRESELLISPALGYRKAFSRWGIEFRMDTPGAGGLEKEGEEYVQMLVRCVPEVVKDKLLQGDELRDLVKGYLATLEEGGVWEYNEDDLEPSATEEGFGWMKALRFCPRELIDLANSKACRGAIMFNDTLDQEQCERLVFQLSETALPFQCAHGRPSLIPLVNLEAAKSQPPVVREVNWGHFLRV